MLWNINTPKNNKVPHNMHEQIHKVDTNKDIANDNMKQLYEERSTISMLTVWI
uniref:Uncharacterized protein n=1 Tax=Arundo donax TaxID=35708 RepID=A0A0A9AVY4_ARUDO